MPAIPREQVRATLSRIERVLVDACGADKRLSKADLARALEQLAPSEQAAVDAFASELHAKHRGSVITVADIERATRSAQTRLAPKTVNGKPAPAELDAADVKAAVRFGEGLVHLTSLLVGDWSAVLPPLPPLSEAELAGKKDAELLDFLRAQCSPHITLSYGTARDVMFGVVDAKGGVVREVYTGREVPVTPRAEMAAAHSINTEHTHPRSLGVDGTPALSDLHHLFPTDAQANGKRSSLPFGDVVKVVWEQAGSQLGQDASGALVFEPPDAHKGDAARAMFYVAAMYGLKMDDHEEAALRAWNKLDPVDETERARNDAIAAIQENRNPFVDRADLVDDIGDF